MQSILVFCFGNYTYNFLHVIVAASANFIAIKQIFKLGLSSLLRISAVVMVGVNLKKVGKPGTAFNCTRKCGM